MRISRTTRPCTLHLKVYVTYHAGTTFNRGRTRQLSNNPKALYSHLLLHRFQPKPRRWKRKDGSAFSLTYSLRLRSCRSMGAFLISPLPPMLSKSSCAVRPLRSTGVTPLHHYYEPRRHRLAFGRFPGKTGYTAYLAPAISAWGEDGFSSCLACPCHRAVPTTPPEGCASTVSLRRTLLPSPDLRELGLQGYFCRGHPWVHSHYGPVTRSPS